MKRLSPFLILIVVISCNKSKVEMPLIGKWRMVELFNGSPQGCSCWGQISPMYADVLELKLDGKYKIIKPSFSSSIGCSGKYRMANDSTIVLTADCGLPGPAPDGIGIYSPSLKQLTIEYGYSTLSIVKYKYVKL